MPEHTHYNCTLRTGAVALGRPQSFIGLLIAMAQFRIRSWRPFSHAAPVVVGNLREMLDDPQYPDDVLEYTIDAAPPKVTATRIDIQLLAGASLMIRDVPTQVRAHVPPDLLQARTRDWLRQTVGFTGYDTLRLFQLLVRCPFDWRPTRVIEDTRRRLVKTICSSYTTRTLEELFCYDAVPERAHLWTVPSDIAGTRGLVTLTRELRLDATM